MPNPTHWSASSDLTDTVRGDVFAAHWARKDGSVLAGSRIDREFFSGPGGGFEVCVLTPQDRGKIIQALDKAYEAGIEAAREQMRAALGVRADR